MLGQSCIMALCRGQAVIALSSGEAEYYGLVTGCSESLGVRSLAKDWGICLPIHMWMDATAGAAIGSRRGLGRVKHIDTIFLWVQDILGRKLVTIGKNHTSENLADILTTSVDGPLIRRMMEGMGVRFLDGRNGAAYG